MTGPNGRARERWLRIGLLVLSLHVAACGAGAPRKPVAGGASGEAIRGSTPGYALHPRGDIWQPAANGNAKHDLVLEAPRYGASAFVIASERTDWSLDDVVAPRRAALIQNGASSYQETRFFLDESQLIPAALLRAQVRENTIQALSVVTPKGTFVVVGVSQMLGEDAVRDLVTSVRVEP